MRKRLSAFAGGFSSNSYQAILLVIALLVIYVLLGVLYERLSLAGPLTSKR